MSRLDVRCCCQPKKILGSLEVPAFVKDRFGCGKEIVTDKKGVDHIIDIQIIMDKTKWEPAIYSEDRPIEFWKTFESFIPT